MNRLPDLVPPFEVDQQAAGVLAPRLADALAVPPPQSADAGEGPDSPRWDGQSLSCGHSGIALLHGIRALDGHGPWTRAAEWFIAAVREPIAGAGGAGLWHGAPALAFALHTAVRPGDADQHLNRLDVVISAMTDRQIKRADERMAEGRRPSPGEFDLVRGLTGLGVYFLRRDPTGPHLREVLGYLVRLTAPIPAEDSAGTCTPGWWTGHLPEGRPAIDFAHGHSDQGMAHGIAGPLALLSLTFHAGIIVPGQAKVIMTIRDWLEHWQQTGEAGPWWPERLTLADLDHAQPHQKGPARPSWCYGTPGITRALQLAALALGDAERQYRAEQALLACISDRSQLSQLGNLALCHGWDPRHRSHHSGVRPWLDRAFRREQRACGRADE
ncbi:lanthionine synthetase C family protein [Sinosporangium siamense]|nr:lanthionine synthetase C family protein [Sinosporangium siamense]